MSAQTLYLLNQAVTMRNLDKRRAQTAQSLADRARYSTLALAWEMKARNFAKIVGTQLVSMPDKPGVLIAEVFRGIFA